MLTKESEEIMEFIAKADIKPPKVKSRIREKFSLTPTSQIFVVIKERGSIIELSDEKGSRFICTKPRFKYHFKPV